MFKKFLLVATFFAAVFSPGICIADIILYQFTTLTGTSTSVTAPTAGISLGSFSTGNQNATSGIPTGTQFNATSSSNNIGASGGGNIGLAAFSGALSTATSSFLSVTLTNGTGNDVTLDDFDFTVRTTSTGAQLLQLRSSTNSFSTDLISSIASSNTSVWTFKNQVFAPISLGSGPSVELRLYATGVVGSPNSGVITTRFDDISIGITAVPEPTSIALICMAGVTGFIGVYRRRKSNRIVAE